MSMGLMPVVHRRGGASNPMILLFDTSLEAGEQITLPLRGTVNCNVDWGDGSDDDYTTTGDKTHTYGSGGVYEVRITGTLTTFGTGAAYANIAKLTQCTSFGTVGLTSVVGGFHSATNLTVAPASIPPGLVTLDFLFFGCASFNQDISGWNVSSVTGMGSMFRGATAFNQNLGAWNVGSVVDMTNMFDGATAFTGAGIADWSITGFVGPNGLNNFAVNATFSTANYDAILVAWEANKASYRSDLKPNFGASKYTGSSAASTARAALVTYGWTITDGGAA